MPTSSLESRKVLFWSLFGATVVAAVLIFWPFISALLWATVLSVLMWPVYKRLQARFSKNFSALVATVVTALVIVLPFAAIGTVIGIQIYHFTNQLAQDQVAGGQTFSIDMVATKTDEMVKPVLQQLGLGDVNVKEYIVTHRDEISQALRGPITKGVVGLGYTVLTLVLALFTMFFMLRDGPRLLEPVCELVPLPRDETINILLKMQGTIQSVFVGVVMVSIIQAAIAGLTYWILGVPSPLFFAFVTFVFCTIPMLGGPVVFVPLAAKLLVDGHTVQAIILLIVGFGVISTVDNFLRPKFISERSELHEMTIFFALLGGVVVIGPIGLMAGPLVATLLAGLTDVIRTRRRLDEDTDRAFA